MSNNIIFLIAVVAVILIIIVVSFSMNQPSGFLRPLLTTTYQIQNGELVLVKKVPRSLQPIILGNQTNDNMISSQGGLYTCRASSYIFNYDMQYISVPESVEVKYNSISGLTVIVDKEIYPKTLIIQVDYQIHTNAYISNAVLYRKVDDVPLFWSTEYVILSNSRSYSITFMPSIELLTYGEAEVTAIQTGENIVYFEMVKNGLSFYGVTYKQTSSTQSGYDIYALNKGNNKSTYYLAEDDKDWQALKKSQVVTKETILADIRSNNYDYITYTNIRFTSGLHVYNSNFYNLNFHYMTLSYNNIIPPNILSVSMTASQPTYNNIIVPGITDKSILGCVMILAPNINYSNYYITVSVSNSIFNDAETNGLLFEDLQSIAMCEDRIYNPLADKYIEPLKDTTPNTTSDTIGGTLDIIDVDETKAGEDATVSLLRESLNANLDANNPDTIEDTIENTNHNEDPYFHLYNLKKGDAPYIDAEYEEMETYDGYVINRLKRGGGDRVACGVNDTPIPTNSKVKIINPTIIGNNRIYDVSCYLYFACHIRSFYNSRCIFVNNVVLQHVNQPAIVIYGIPFY